MVRSPLASILWCVAVFLIGMRGAASQVSLALLPAFFCLIVVGWVRFAPALRPGLLAVSAVLCLCGGMLSPWVGFAAVIAGGSGLLAALQSMRCQHEREAVPFRGIQLLFAAWIVAELLLEVLRLMSSPRGGVPLFTTNWWTLEWLRDLSQGGFTVGLTVWLSETPRLVRQLEIFLAFSLFAAFCSPGNGEQLLAWCRKHTIAVFSVLSIVTLIFVVQALAQWGHVSLLELPAMASAHFFAQQNRLSGPFVDPNSAGMVLACMLIALASMGAKAAALIVGALLLLTGTRSALILVAVLVLARFIFGAASGASPASFSRDLGAVVRRTFGVVAAGGVLLVVVNLLPAAWVNQLPVGLERTVESLRLESSSEALFSRNALWRVALAQFKDAPLLGVGLDRYRELLAPYAQALKLPLGVWSDNPGNWFLFVAVELGVVGVFFLLIDLLRLRVAESRAVSSRVPILFAVAVSLLFGCHLHDPASAIFLGLLTSIALRPECKVDAGGRSAARYADLCNGIRWPAVSPVLAVLAFPGIVLCSLSFPRGLYGWEVAGASALSRWTSASATLAVPCRGGAPLVEFGAIPISRRAQMELVVSPYFPLLASNHETKVSLSGAEQNGLQNSMRLDVLVCPATPDPGLLAGIGIDLGYRLVSLQVTPPWVPSESGIGTDSRILGVQLRYKEPWPLPDL